MLDENNELNSNNKFRFFNDSTGFDAVGEYEVDIPYTYSPIYMDDDDFTANRSEGNQNTLVIPPPAANIPPQSSPPPFIPSKTEISNSGNSVVKDITTENMKDCFNKFTYVWQLNGRSYWAYITSCDKKSLSGWRFIAFKWIYFGVDLSKIECYISY